MNVTKLHKQRLPAVTATDALSLENAPLPIFREENLPGAVAHRVEFVWDIVAPKLPKGAIERLRVVDEGGPVRDGSASKPKTRVPFEPRIFELQKQIYVLLRDDSDVEQVRQLAQSLGAKVVVE